MEKQKLYMLLLGCKPEGRHTEQHDVFFHIGVSLESLIPAIIEFWPEAKGKIHVDAWREVTQVGNFAVTVRERGGADVWDRVDGGGSRLTTDVTATETSLNMPRLYFINLGGYKRDVFEEFHYKMIAVADDKGAAIRQAKETAFYQHTGFKGASSHVDDKYGINVDDAHEIVDILPAALSKIFSIDVQRAPGREDEMHLGYFPLAKLKGEDAKVAGG